MTADLRSRVTASSLRAHLPRILLGFLFLLPGTIKLVVPFDAVSTLSAYLASEAAREESGAVVFGSSVNSSRE